MWNVDNIVPGQDRVCEGTETFEKGGSRTDWIIYFSSHFSQRKEKLFEKQTNQCFRQRQSQSVKVVRCATPRCRWPGWRCCRPPRRGPSWRGTRGPSPPSATTGRMMMVMMMMIMMTGDGALQRQVRGWWWWWWWVWSLSGPSQLDIICNGSIIEIFYKQLSSSSGLMK